MTSRLEESKETWNNFSHAYIETMEYVTSVIFKNICPLAKIESASQILEVGCGAGNGVKILCSKKPQNAKITACDISEVMISIAQSRDLADTTFFVANNENLPFQNGTFDRYIANLSLHLVEHPIKMIEEAYRVLQPRGIALFTSPGKLGLGNFMSLISKAKTLAGEERYSNYYLSAGDDEGLRKKLKDSGFSRVFTFYSSACFPVSSADEVVKFIGKNYAIEYLKTVNPEMHKNALDILKAEITEILDTGHAITFDYLAAVAFRDN